MDNESCRTCDHWAGKGSTKERQKTYKYHCRAGGKTLLVDGEAKQFDMMCYFEWCPSYVLMNQEADNGQG
jgi:hypothetical protein